MTAEQYISLGKRTAIISFLLGTTIFALYFFTSESDFLFAGYIFIILAGLVNLVILIAISFKLLKDKGNIKKLVKIGVFMSLNIPVMIIYCWIAIMLMGIHRITFTNSTQTELNNIKITGCEEKRIDKLEIGESTTVWINIPNDCAINIEYVFNGQRKEENVIDYTTSCNGGKTKYKIGGKE